MKSALTIILIFSFVGIAVFGFSAMNHGSGHTGCIAATSRLIDCPANASGILDFIAFHLNAFQNFSVAVISDNLLTAFLFFAAFLFAIALRPANSKLSPAFLNPGANWRIKYKEPFANPLKSQLTHWLILHENSPSLI
ncbi:MAG: hypothetical protein A3H63_01665 [Candidatus Harrisonbacteria bacterium RIFCSPLOWO2_02_FULL_45_10c]|uniref:Uncharacterized protein n=1 Tax=Candidatus Harrisonbacteria bacterium RIFCSPLOWO2_02_FULL_45_10c TaxID=1798410 RepID=A0A1G1ZW18_9BACT|nr:MAG: hypothetical protein A3H63_01665 [Candidatus Harrisonbacteria bacterium RIFCSPLOWO2_02_FULL_45_10c]